MQILSSKAVLHPKFLFLLGTIVQSIPIFNSILLLLQITPSFEGVFDAEEALTPAIRRDFKAPPKDKIVITQWHVNCVDRTNRVGFNLKMRLEDYYWSKHAEKFKALFVHFCVKIINDYGRISLLQIYMRQN